MLCVRILCVGKMREKFYAEAVREYSKRLTGKVKTEIIEVKDEPAPESLSPAMEQAVKRAEGERLLKNITPADHVIALCIDGKRWDSVGFAKHIDALMSRGKSRIAFVIGGSIGLDEAVIRRADEKLSFSDFTFCHQLMRVILMEQVYRAIKINNNEPYHK